MYQIFKYNRQYSNIICFYYKKQNTIHTINYKSNKNKFIKNFKYFRN